MHLGLTDRPFVPHNLSTQESLVPLLKFQMAPRLKIVVFSGSKKGTQIQERKEPTDDTSIDVYFQ